MLPRRELRLGSRWQQLQSNSSPRFPAHLWLPYENILLRRANNKDMKLGGSLSPCDKTEWKGVKCFVIERYQWKKYSHRGFYELDLYSAKNKGTNSNKTKPLFLQRAGVWFPSAHTGQLTTACNFGSRGFSSLFWFPKVQIYMCTHTYTQIYFKILNINQPREYRLVGECLPNMHEAMWSNTNKNKSK